MKGLRIYLIVGAILVILYIIAQFNQPKAINWDETLNSDDKIPFGTYILHDRLKDIFPGSNVVPYHEPVYNVIGDDSVKNSSYVIICKQIPFTKYDYEKLTGYISKGNDVFISAEIFGEALSNELQVKTALEMEFMSKVVVPIKFINPTLDTAKQYKVDKACTNIFFTQFDTAKATVVGKDTAGNANFLRYRFGKGNLYLTCNPKIFSNYSMLTADGAAYAATALSYIKNTKTLIWDEHYTQGDDAESLMRVFFNNEYLQWAYYITLFSLLVFVIYEMKRRQRIIPVIAPLKNSTVEFVNVVGQVYYENRNNVDIAHKQVLYILAYLREEYHIKTDKLDEEFIERLTGKIGLDEAFAQQFTQYLLFISVADRVSDNELIALNKLIEQFYIKSR